MPPKKRGEGALARYNAKKPTVSFRVYDTGMKDAIYAQAKRKGLSVSAYLSDLVAADLDGKKPKPKKRKANKSIPELDIPDYADEMQSGPVHNPDMPQWDKENETYAEYQKRYFDHLKSL